MSRSHQKQLKPEKIIHTNYTESVYHVNNKKIISRLYTTIPKKCEIISDTTKLKFIETEYGWIKYIFNESNHNWTQTREQYKTIKSIIKSVLSL